MKEAVFIAVSVHIVNVSDMYKVAYYGIKNGGLEEHINTVCKGGVWELHSVTIDEPFYLVIYKKVKNETEDKG